LKFLLIDFGASFIKSSIYNKELNVFTDYKEYNSPLSEKNKITCTEIETCLIEIMNSYNYYDVVVSCSIKNGSFENNEYVSWKALNPNSDYKKESVVGCLFKEQKNYHLHNDHDSKSNIFNLKKLGVFYNKVFLSCLGDTDCVKRSVELDEKSILINLGTGSQIIYKNKIISFFPSGRMFLAFERFFKCFGKDFFKELQSVSLQDINNSSLIFNINIFEQSRNFDNFGFIKNINEFNLTKINFLSSLLKAYIDQYICEIDFSEIDKIYLSGGIAKKIPVILEYVKQKTNITATLVSSDIPETHLGMKKLIDLDY
jgi:hypothetical protein